MTLTWNVEVSLATSRSAGRFSGYRMPPVKNAVCRYDPEGSMLARDSAADDMLDSEVSSRFRS